MKPEVTTCEPANQDRALANLGDGFEIILADEQSDTVEIVNGDEKFEVLCAYHAHPYCTLAEDRFVEAFYNPADNWRLVRRDNQQVQIYLRNKKTLASQKATFPADLVLKKNGVRSAIVVSPSSLAGLFCAPADEHNTWVVFRPFSRNFLAPEIAAKYPGLGQVALSPSIDKLPKVDFPLLEWESRPDTDTSSSIDLSALAPQGVVSKREKYLFKTVRHLYLEEDERCKVRPPVGNRFKLDTESVTEMPDLNGRFLIFGKPPLRWPEMSDQQTRFTDTHLSSHGYLEFTCGQIVLEDGQYYFITEKPVSTLEGLGSYIHEIPRTKVEQEASATGTAIASAAAAADTATTAVADASTTPAPILTLSLGAESEAA